MKKIFLIATAILLAGGAASYATTSTVQIDGTYSLSYTPTNGSKTDMSFSSVPGDGAVAGGDLGSQSMSGQQVTNNPFNESLTVGTPLTVNFFTASPAGSCSGCSGTTASGTITATFTFSEPSGATGTMTTTGTYSANYNGTLSCDTHPSVPNQADCVVWNQPDPLTVNFTNGDVLTVTLNNAHDWAITPTVTFSIAPSAGGTTKVPEPASLLLLASGVAGVGALRRRRKAA